MKTKLILATAALLQCLCRPASAQPLPPLLHVVASNEFGLHGLADPERHVAGSAGGKYGSLDRYTWSLTSNDCAMTYGITRPDSERTDGEPLYNCDFLSWNLTIANLGGPLTLPSDAAAWVPNICDPSWETWVLPDFIQIRIYRVGPGGAETLFKTALLPGRFSKENLFPDMGIYMVDRNDVYQWQRLQVNDLKSGTARIEIMTNPALGPCEAANHYVEFNGQNVNLVAPPVFPFGTNVTIGHFDPTLAPLKPAAAPRLNIAR